ncbi:Transcription antitermination protein RfaH [Pseudomonas coronafaciens pv. atropurpurea]|nr:Transcription antitermination protein RfaH [Pseudomonas coronafaciens pv. atropurpurea]
MTFGGQPVPVRDALIEQIRQRLSAPSADTRFTRGDIVLINTGSLSAVEAIFLTADGSERAVILLSMLQRQHQVVLPISSLSRVQARA